MKVISRDLADEMALSNEFTWSYEKLAGRQLRAMVNVSGAYSIQELEYVLEALRETEKKILENLVLLIPSS